MAPKSRHLANGSNLGERLAQMVARISVLEGLVETLERKFLDIHPEGQERTIDNLNMFAERARADRDEAIVVQRNLWSRLRTDSNAIGVELEKKCSALRTAAHKHEQDAVDLRRGLTDLHSCIKRETDNSRVALEKNTDEGLKRLREVTVELEGRLGESMVPVDRVSALESGHLALQGRLSVCERAYECGFRSRQKNLVSRSRSGSIDARSSITEAQQIAQSRSPRGEHQSPTHMSPPRCLSESSRRGRGGGETAGRGVGA